MLIKFIQQLINVYFLNKTKRLTNIYYNNGRGPTYSNELRYIQRKAGPKDLKGLIHELIIEP